MVQIMADLASNWARVGDIIDMFNYCKKLYIKYVKLQLFTKNEVRDYYWDNIISPKMAADLFEYGKMMGLEIYFTPCYPEAVDICKRIGVNLFKIRYKDRNNPDIFEKMQDVHKPIFVSCEDPKDTLYYGMKNVIFLYCKSIYPASIDDYNLLHIFRCKGVSDHTEDLFFFDHFGDYFQYWEMHMGLDDNCKEHKWSKTFEELELRLL